MVVTSNMGKCGYLIPIHCHVLHLVLWLVSMCLDIALFGIRGPIPGERWREWLVIVLYSGGSYNTDHTNVCQLHIRRAIEAIGIPDIDMDDGGSSGSADSCLSTTLHKI